MPDIVSLLLIWGFFLSIPLFLLVVLVVGAIQWHAMTPGDRAAHREVMKQVSQDSEWSRILHGGVERER